MQNENQEKTQENDKNNKEIKFEKLSNLFEERKIVSIFSNENDTNKFSSGFIAEITEDYILLKHIEPQGLYDGYVTISFSDIFLIEYDGKYEKKLLALYQFRKQSHNDLLDLTGDVIYDLLSFAEKNKFVVTVELLESGLDNTQGFIKELKNGLITIEKIDSYGFNDGTAQVNIGDVTHIFCDTDTEIALRLLYKINKKQ